MPFARPTLLDLIDRIEADYASRLGLPGILHPGVLAGLAASHAGSAHGNHGHLDWIVDQVFPDTADDAEMQRWASIFGMNRKEASKAQGTVNFTGSPLSVIPAGTVIKRQDGQEYSTDAEVVISPTDIDAEVTALLPGILGNEVVGMVLTLASPVPGVSSEVTVAGIGLVNGADQESDDNLRARLLEKLRTPPMGGADQDYVIWSKEVADITRAWVFGGILALNDVSVYVATDDLVGGPIPTAGKIAEVLAYLEDGRRPVGADVSVLAPIAVDLDPDITLLGASSAAIKDAVEASLTDLLRRSGSPGGTIMVSHIREAISTAAGEVDHILVSPAADVTHSTGELPVLGTITWS